MREWVLDVTVAYVIELLFESCRSLAFERRPFSILPAMTKPGNGSVYPVWTVSN